MLKFKKTLSLMLSVLLLFGLFTGCAEPEVPETRPELSVSISSTAPQLPGTPDPPTDPTPTEPALTEPVPTQAQRQPIPERPWSVDSWVTDGYREEFTWTSEMGHEYHVPVSVPTIVQVGEFAEAFNQSVAEYVGWRINELRECMESKTDTHLVSISYEAFLNREILSIVLTEETCVDLTYYKVWNFDLDDREEMTTAEMADEYLDLDYVQFLMLTNEMILAEFNDRFDQFRENDPQSYAEMTHHIERDTTAMYNRYLYLGENGALMLVYDQPSIAGAMYYPAIIPFDRGGTAIPSERDAYAWFFDLAGKVDGAYADGYAVLTAAAFKEDDEDFSEHLSRRIQEDINKIVSLLTYGWQDSPERLRRIAEDLDEASVRNAILAALGAR